MGYSLVNILGGLLIVTSTMVVVSKTIPSAIKWYAIQSVVLVGVLLTLGYGEAVTLGAFTCRSEKTGMTCTNGLGHGFSIAKAQQRLF